MRKLNKINIAIGIFDLLLYIAVELVFVSYDSDIYLASTIVGALAIAVHGYGTYYYYSKVKNKVSFGTNLVALFYGAYLLISVIGFYYRPVLLVIAVILLANGLIKPKEE